MAERRRRNSRGNGRSPWYRVHRVAGLVSAAFVLLLAVTGLALNHTAALGLDQRHVAPDWLLDWYGIEAPPPPESYAAGPARVTRLGNRLWLGTEPVLDAVSDLHGAVAAGRFLVAALGDGVVLFTADGRLVERLGAAAGVPGDIRRIGTVPGGGIAVDTPEGVFVTDAALAEWRLAPDAAPEWSEASPPPEAMRADLERAWRGRGLTLERILLDLHSGRLLGRFGVWLMDIMALLFVCLAATGLWLWTRRRNGRRQARKPN